MASPSTPIPLPAQDPIARRRDWTRYPRRDQVDPREGLPTDTWLKYLTKTADAISLTAQRQAIVEVSAQTASIAATPIALGSNPAGLYTIRYYATLQRAAAVSSSLTLTFSWTHGGQTKTLAPSAMTGNTTASVLTGSLSFRLDHAAPITWATTYASSGSPTMQYYLLLIVERVG